MRVRTALPRPSVAVAMLALMLVAPACTFGGDTEPTAAPAPEETTTAPTSSPSPTPTPTVQPVEGERVERVTSVSSDVVLGLGRATRQETESLDTAVRDIGDWLDRHLDQLQRSGEGLLDEVTPEGVAPPDIRRPVTTGLTSPEHPVASARYVLTAFHDGPVQMVTVDVVVDHPDGGSSQAHLVFTVDSNGQVALALLGPGEASTEGEA